MPPFLLMSSSCASYHFCWSAGEAMPKMLLAAGPTMFVRVTATLICVAETPVTPLAAGHPGASAPPAVPPAVPAAAPAFDVVPPDPPAAVAPAGPPLAFGPAPAPPGAPFASGPVPGSPESAPPPEAARLVDLGPDPGTRSHASSTMTSTIATLALIRSA